ncbi:MAG: ankyrin repeat domain-containing protein, partial [Candidatus Heimdallarchaeota archaeon]|nr:ankyrin repeat domain-containing protein [Candidatus Heimdallarchaeota archaeon]
EAADNEGKTPFINAVYNKKHELAGYLLEKGADINAKEGNGWSALMFASMGGQTECVKMLIMAGADVNCRTSEDETPLQRAEKLQEAGLGDYKEIIEVLKGAGGE